MNIFEKCSSILEDYSDTEPKGTSQGLLKLYDSLDDNQVDEITHIQYLLIEQLRCLVD